MFMNVFTYQDKAKQYLQRSLNASAPNEIS